MVQTREACYGNYLQWTCVRLDDRAIPSRRCSYTGKISQRKFQKILSHTCPSGRWTTQAYFCLTPILTPSLQIGALGHLKLQEFGVNSIRAQRRDISSEAVFLVYCAVKPKSILEVGSMVRSSIEDPFR
jgi:hypothetical protein